jgi:hypothetical protein
MPSTADLLRAVTILQVKYRCDLTRIRIKNGANMKVEWTSADQFLTRRGILPGSDLISGAAQ